jgi:prophage DNA circulation protein
VAAGEAALAVAAGFGANGSDLYGWLAGLNAMAVRVVSNIAADAVPLVRVETGVSLPSSVLAYKLYGDATRAEGLVDIARSMTPMLMPSVFEALES